MINLLDPQKVWVKSRLYRDSCLNVGSYYIKDLNILGRELTHTLIVDNTLYAFAYQVGESVHRARVAMAS